MRKEYSAPCNSVTKQFFFLMFDTLDKVFLSVLSTIIRFSFTNSSALLISVSMVQFKLFPVLLNEMNRLLLVIL